jgi:hypothetical protein
LTSLPAWLDAAGLHPQILGGREEGFRGYGVKANYQPGAWKVQVETGEVYFDLQLVPESARSFALEPA